MLLAGTTGHFRGGSPPVMYRQPFCGEKAAAGLPLEAQSKPHSKRRVVRRLGLVLEEPADFGQNLGVHGGRDAAGLRVLLTGVVDAEEARSSGGDFGFRAMSEFETRARSDHAALLEDVEIAIPGDFAERKNRFRLKNLDLAFQVSAAIQDFSRERFVFWRSAAAGCGDVSIFELEAVIAVKGSGLIREACFVEGGVEKIA